MFEKVQIRSKIAEFHTFGMFFLHSMHHSFVNFDGFLYINWKIELIGQKKFEKGKKSQHLTLLPCFFIDCNIVLYILMVFFFT